MHKRIVLSALGLAAAAAAFVFGTAENDSSSFASLRPLDATSAIALASRISMRTSDGIPNLDMSCDMTVPTDQTVIDGTQSEIAPGDVICLAGGARPPLRIKSIRATAALPVTLINSGPVAIRGTFDDYAGIKVIDSHYVRISGAGSDIRCGAGYQPDEQRCGISISGSSRGISGTEGTTGLVVDHVAVFRTSHSGVFARSKADEGQSRKDFTQHDTVVASSYFHNIGREGLYLGSSSYASGEDALLIGVRVENNLFVGTGWDGIQVGSAVSDCVIRRNVVILAGTEDRENQNSGIIVNRGSSCDVSHNIVISSARAGIYVHGNGNHSVNDNLVVGAGAHDSDGDGIVVRTGSNPGKAIRVAHNTVVAPARHGIRMLDDSTDHHTLLNNLVIAATDAPFQWRDGITATGNLAFDRLDVLAEPTKGDFRPASRAVLLEGVQRHIDSPDLFGIDPGADGRQTAGAIEWRESG